MAANANTNSEGQPMAPTGMTTLAQGYTQSVTIWTIRLATGGNDNIAQETPGGAYFSPGTQSVPSVPGFRNRWESVATTGASKGNGMGNFNDDPTKPFFIIFGIMEKRDMAYLGIGFIAGILMMFILFRSQKQAVTVSSPVTTTDPLGILKAQNNLQSLYLSLVRDEYAVPVDYEIFKRNLVKEEKSKALHEALIKEQYGNIPIDYPSFAREAGINLLRVHAYIQSINPEFTINFDSFAEDMENAENLKKVHEKLGQYNSKFTKDYETFAFDMGINDHSILNEFGSSPSPY